MPMVASFGVPRPAAAPSPHLRSRIVSPPTARGTREDAPCAISALAQKLRARAKSLWGACWDWQARRAAELMLEALDDRALEDIGLTRSQIRSAACGLGLGPALPRAAPAQNVRLVGPASGRAGEILGRPLTEGCEPLRPMSMPALLFDRVCRAPERRRRDCRMPATRRRPGERRGPCGRCGVGARRSGPAAIVSASRPARQT
jgi:uncharacterized protein YjiS (DUF1127 family)